MPSARIARRPATLADQQRITGFRPAARSRRTAGRKSTATPITSQTHRAACRLSCSSSGIFGAAGRAPGGPEIHQQRSAAPSRAKRRIRHVPVRKRNLGQGVGHRLPSGGMLAGRRRALSAGDARDGGCGCAEGADAAVTGTRGRPAPQAQTPRDAGGKDRVAAARAAPRSAGSV